MKDSTIKSKKDKVIHLWAFLFWLVVWHIASIVVGQEILLVSPVSVVKRLAFLIVEASFWKAILFSLVRIIGGFFLAMFLGTLCGILSTRYGLVRELLAPISFAIKATPVASFVIVALIWIPSRNLSVFISFLMCFPIMYTNVLQGISNTDRKLLEMMNLFHVTSWRRVRYLYFPQVLPYFRSACSIALGLCWKSGIAAEVIGIPKGSIGEKLYNAKIYLMTADLFAWTIVIILVSILFEKLFLKGLNIIEIRNEGRNK